MTRKADPRIAVLEAQIKEAKNMLIEVGDREMLKGIYASKIERLEKELYEVRWGRWARASARVLGQRKFKYDPSCGNAKYVLPNCQNTNLEADGFCTICDRHHFKVMFGKVVKSSSRRTDGGCMAFGDSNDSDFAGCDVMMPGTSSTALYSNRPGRSQAKSIKTFINGKLEAETK